MVYWYDRDDEWVVYLNSTMTTNSQGRLMMEYGLWLSSSKSLFESLQEAKNIKENLIQQFDFSPNIMITRDNKRSSTGEMAPDTYMILDSHLDELTAILRFS